MKTSKIQPYNARFITTAALLVYVAQSPAFCQKPVSVSSLPPGTVIPVRLNDDLASDHSRIGDRFSATVDASKHGYSNFKGVQVEGVVAGVSVKDGTKPGTIRLKFDKIRGPHGKAFKFDGVGAPLTGDNFDLNSTPYHVKNTQLTGQFVGSTYKPLGGRKGKEIVLSHGDTIAVVTR